jgi:hypothetical protein
VQLDCSLVALQASFEDAFLEPPTHLIIYDDIVSEEFGNLIDDILLAVTCIKYFWTGQISEEKLFGNCILIVRFGAAGSHQRVAPIFHTLLKKIL